MLLSFCHVFLLLLFNSLSVSCTLKLKTISFNVQVLDCVLRILIIYAGFYAINPFFLNLNKIEFSRSCFRNFICKSIGFYMHILLEFGFIKYNSRIKIVPKKKKNLKNYTISKKIAKDEMRISQHCIAFFFADTKFHHVFRMNTNYKYYATI